MSLDQTPAFGSERKIELVGKRRLDLTFFWTWPSFSEINRIESDLDGSRRPSSRSTLAG